MGRGSASGSGSWNGGMDWGMESFAAVVKVARLGHVEFGPNSGIAKIGTGIETSTGEKGAGFTEAPLSKSTALSNTTAISPKPKYYTPIFPSSHPGTFTANRKEVLIGQAWRQISTWDAEECLRPEGSGIEVGDGEEWVRMDGEERLWCGRCGVGWGLEGWVRV